VRDLASFNLTVKSEQPTATLLSGLPARLPEPLRPQQPIAYTSIPGLADISGSNPCPGLIIEADGALCNDYFGCH